ncbi:MFS transporter [Sphingomonas phyllosphaerae]|uniref:MFS transporter n=1 Tax=Sphingomonas phyllosphaerae TaxID=257003 RepID=UPI000426FF2D|nr:MFS transporter [Sphingomonas phyllosphaerae]
MSGFTSATAGNHSPSGEDGTPVRWSAVYALALCSFVLVASEFMPISLLSPIAATLDLSPGQVGQAIAASGLFALGTSLLVTNIFGAIDRRIVLLGLTVLLMVSGAIVATAPSFPILMAGRALLGVAIGGFWSMSAAIAMRLVPQDAVPKALAIVNGGNALASTLAAPLGSFLGSLIGWRGTFLVAVPLGLLALVWQFVTVPSLPAACNAGGTKVFALLRRPALVTGLLGVLLFFAGHFALFTFLRPFLEHVTGLGVSMISLMLLVIGVSGFIGTVVIGRFLDDDRLYLMLAILPAIMAAVAVALTIFGGSTPAAFGLLAMWGLTGTAAPVAWWTWLSRAVPDEAEAGGGLMVAAAQLAITLGSGIGGIVFDTLGMRTEFLTSAALLFSTACIAWFAMRPQGRPALCASC